MKIIFYIMGFMFVIVSLIIAFMLYEPPPSHIKLVEQRKQSGETIADKDIIDTVNIDMDKLYLIHQNSIPACISGSSYGLIDGDKDNIYIDKGCSGVFAHNGMIGSCSNDHPEETYYKCPIGRYHINKFGRIVGLKKADLELIKDISGKCKVTNYGMDTFGKMYVKNGCDGLFKYGNLQGYCYSTSSIGKSLCPIGKTEKDKKNNVVGLRSRPVRFNKPMGDCDVSDVGKTLKFDGKEFSAVGTCALDVEWGELEGYCKGSKCPIGSKIIVEGGNVGIVAK